MLKTITTLLLAITAMASGAHAQDDLSTARLYDPGNVLKWATDSSMSKKLVVVGGISYAGSDSTDINSWSVGVVAFDARSGSQLWFSGFSTSAGPAAVTSVAVGKKISCVAGAEGDNDGGANAFIHCYSNKNGTAVWAHEYENPLGDSLPVSFFVGPEASDDARPTVEILGKRVVLRVPYSDGATGDQVSVVLFDAKTGEAL